MAAKAHAEANLKEDNIAVLAVEGVDVQRRIGRHSSGVDDVGGREIDDTLFRSE